MGLENPTYRDDRRDILVPHSQLPELTELKKEVFINDVKKIRHISSRNLPDSLNYHERLRKKDVYFSVG
ncbi:MAG: hypothetical protein AABZ07_00960 [Nitrospirota bacterium]